MATKPRTVRYFPKMKVRGFERRALAGWDRTLRRWDLLNFSAVEAGHAFGALAEAGVRASDQVLGLKAALELAQVGGYAK